MKLPLFLLCLSSLIAHTHPSHEKLVKEESKKIELPKVIGHNGLTYSYDYKWMKTDRKTAPVRNGHAIAEDKAGNLYFVTDHLDVAIHVLKKDGTYIRSIGKGLSGGHGIEIFERDGKEHIIHVDSGWHANPEPGGKTIDNDGKISILTLDGRVTQAFPNPRTLEENPPKKKFKPCDVAVTPSGSILVVDGYASDYIYEFSPQGELLKRWGGRTKDAANLDNAHGISIDTTDPEKPLVWVSSRNQNQLKAFTLDGKHVENINLPGAFAGQLVIRDGKMYTAVCWSRKDGTGKRQPQSGFILILDAKTRKVLSAPGGTEPTYIDGTLQPMQQKHTVFRHGHDLHVDSDGNIYVAEWASGSRFPIKLTPAS